ncbi:MAG: NAD-binding protein [Cyanobacterium sp.]
MKLKYDLILIGGSLEAIWGAKYAANFGARVALIIDVDFATENGEKYLFQQLQSELLSPHSFHNRQDILEQKRLLIEHKLLPELVKLEVDIIFSGFEFILESNQTAIKTKEDILMANGYILTTPLYDHQHPNWLGIEEVNYLTGYDIFKLWDIDSLPENLVVVGDDDIAVNISSLLIRHQKKVTLLTTKKHILPWEDADIAFLVQCQLEGMGVNILTNYQVNQFKYIDNSKWILAGKKAIECQEIIISDSLLKKRVALNFHNLSNKKQPKFDPINTNIFVSNKLQTDNHNIYCVGSLLGGYSNLNIASEELKIAINNILFLNFNEANYDVIPYHINISSGVFRVGYSESQVRNLYGDSSNSFVVQKSFLSPFDLEQKDVFIKLIISKSKKILGCHCWGYKGDLLVNIVSTIMKQDENINALFKVSISDDFIREVVDELEERITKKYSMVKFNLFESWFIWRRK